jgi:taurine dioxygenase
VSPCTPAIGAIVEGLDLARPMTIDLVSSVKAALNDHLVLFIRDQVITSAQQRDFANCFGPLYKHPFYAGTDDASEVMLLESNETRRPSADRWHNDVTYLKVPPAGAVLYAEEIPQIGGDTLWANMYLAFEALSEPVQRLVSELHAVHSFAKNFTPERFAAIGMEGQRDALYAEHPPVSHPVARTNPETGRKALFVNQDFTTHIEGVPAKESDALLSFLYDHMSRPELQVRWRWQVGDVAFWDNRWTQHCALADHFPARRRVRRATIAGAHSLFEEQEHAAQLGLDAIRFADFKRTDGA